MIFVYTFIQLIIFCYRHICPRVLILVFIYIYRRFFFAFVVYLVIIRLFDYYFYYYFFFLAVRQSWYIIWIFPVHQYLPSTDFFVTF